MLKIKKIIAILLVVCFLASATVMSASACTLRSSVFKNDWTMQQICAGNRLMQYGDNYQSVKLVQNTLMRLGYSIPAGATGYFGPQTKAAVIKYQTAHSYVLAADGIIGPKTLNELDYDIYIIETPTSSSPGVPIYLQGDSRWSSDKLGSSSSTIGAKGCAITSIAMVLKYYGVQTDPKDLNIWLTKNNGYANGNLVYWGTAAGRSGGSVKFIGSFSTDLNKINSELDNGHPVIAEVRHNGSMHFIVITGHSGSSYSINDPAYGKSKLSDSYGSDPAKAIHGIRIYHKA